MEFFRQEYWLGLPFPSPEALPSPGMDFMAPVSSAIAGSLLHGATWEALHLLCITIKKVYLKIECKAQKTHIYPEFTNLHDIISLSSFDGFLVSTLTWSCQTSRPSFISPAHLL